jgi:hypothetical protein
MLFTAVAEFSSSDEQAAPATDAHVRAAAATNRDRPHLGRLLPVRMPRTLSGDLRRVAQREIRPAADCRRSG